jgi:hypothetical protein
MRVDHSVVQIWGSCLLAGAALLGCTSELRPVEPTTKLNDHAAGDVVLALPEACGMVPEDGPTGGRPDGEHAYTLPAGRYVPRFEDDHGVFFASPTGVIVTEPAPRGTRMLPGGIYIYVRSNDRDLAMQYLGDREQGVSGRERLPEHCHYSIETVAKEEPPKSG